MARNNDTGLFQLDNGNWAYRIVINRKELKYDTTCRQDEQGKPLLSKKTAKEARELKLVEVKTHKAPAVQDVKLSTVYDKYIKSGTVGKAASTVRKQQSMWDNHVNKRFGACNLKDITLSNLTRFYSVVTVIYHF